MAASTSRTATSSSTARAPGSSSRQRFSRRLFTPARSSSAMQGPGGNCLTNRWGFKRVFFGRGKFRSWSSTGAGRRLLRVLGVHQKAHLSWPGRGSNFLWHSANQRRLRLACHRPWRRRGRQALVAGVLVFCTGTVAILVFVLHGVDGVPSLAALDLDRLT